MCLFPYLQFDFQKIQVVRWFMKLWLETWGVKGYLEVIVDFGTANCKVMFCNKLMFASISASFWIDFKVLAQWHCQGKKKEDNTDKFKSLFSCNPTEVMYILIFVSCRDHRECPVTGCSCHCMQMDSVGTVLSAESIPPTWHTEDRICYVIKWNSLCWGSVGSRNLESVWGTFFS